MSWLFQAVGFCVCLIFVVMLLASLFQGTYDYIKSKRETKNRKKYYGEVASMLAGASHWFNNPKISTHGKLLKEASVRLKHFHNIDAQSLREFLWDMIEEEELKKSSTSSSSYEDGDFDLPF